MKFFIFIDGYIYKQEKTLQYVYTVKGNRSELDAIDFLRGILMSEYCGDAELDATQRGFKRVLAQTDEEINRRLSRMGPKSPIEYSYKGTDNNAAVYTFWGITSYKKRGHTNVCKDTCGE